MGPSRLSSTTPPIAAGAIAFLAYAAGAAREITGEDAGQLATAAVQAGIPHPPGYPLWCILAHAAVRVLPFGSPCFRIALFSAACAAVAAALVASLVRRLGGGPGAALASGLLLAASRSLWSQAVIVEVYTLSAALLAGGLLAFARWRDRPSPGRLALLALLAGLGLTHHPVLRILSPAILLGAILARPAEILRSRPLLAAGAFVAGLLPFLYLPIRSAADPFMDWGDPETLRSFADHVLRRQYGGARLDPSVALAPGRVAERLGEYARQLGREWPLPLLPFAGAVAVVAASGVGAWRLWSRQRGPLLLLLTLLSLGGPLVVLLLGFDAASRDLGNLGVYAHAALVPLAVLAGAGLGALGRAGAAVGVGVALLAAPSHLVALDKARYPWIADWARNVLETSKEDEILFAYADDAIFPLLYTQQVEGVRRDVLLLGNYNNSSSRAILDGMDPRTLERRRSVSGKALRFFDEAHVARAYAPRPIAVLEPRDPEALPNGEFVPCGLRFRFVRAGESEGPLGCDEVWSLYRWRFEMEEAAPDDPAASVLAWIRTGRGFEALRRGDLDAAIAELRAIEVEGPNAATLYQNAGSALAGAGAFEAAIPFFRRALEFDPTNRVAAGNLARLAVALYDTSRDAARARALLEEASAYGPLPPEAEGLRRALRAAR